jgi:hypothetical protein
MARKDSAGRSVRVSLPPLEHRVSRPDSSTATCHTGATLAVADFPVVKDVGEPRRPMSAIWQRLEDKKLVAYPWSTEACIVSLASLALEDIMFECGLSALLEIVPEVGLFEVRPDMLIVRVGGLPVGVVEVKKPGVGVLDDKRVLGELYDYMKHLPNFCGKFLASSPRTQNGACVGSTTTTRRLWLGALK